ncbi:hypothetical protein [Microvirga sp. VF16]|uniref:hypothetical protein n=1 Tax=Microvirga sp. VF16 TaxID=2807101 RepID=UPI00193D27A6|nr:hypothetical protein [Microvirga sp. VF16]QRM35431.1 hypothetical protein JO965_44600 [Microvirga sp. VF16]
MVPGRQEEEGFDRFARPYERWVYSKELGLPFAFRAIRQQEVWQEGRHVAGLLEGTAHRDAKNDEVRLPPLWPPDKHYAFTPFAFTDDGNREETLDQMLARRLGSLLDRGIAPPVRLNMPIAAASWVTKENYEPDAASETWKKPDSVKKAPAILGVIEDALPFAHRAFLDRDGCTRISHLWLQSARATAKRDRVPFGREITNIEIDTLRADYGPDERRLYREAGAIDRSLPEIGQVLERHSTHGAHILGLAGGNDPQWIAAPQVPDEVQIVAVQLPNTVAWDTSGFGKEMFILSALHYIFVRASEIAQAFEVRGELPLVVNLSYGWSAGPHDGHSEMECAIEELLIRRRNGEFNRDREPQKKSFIVVPMGNNFADKMHAVFSDADMRKGPVRIGWRLLPDDRTASYLEIWFPKEFNAEGWEVRLVPPPGIKLDQDRVVIKPDTALKPVGYPRCFADLKMGGRNVGQLSADHYGLKRWRVILAMIPTAETGSDRRLPPGLWKVEIDPMGCPSLPEGQMIDLWLQRDDDPRLMHMGGRQSHLEELPDTRPKGQPGVVQRYGTLSALASTPSVTRVAGVVGSTGHPTKYSSAGALGRDEHVPRGEPTLAAISDQGVMLPGLRSIGCVSGSGARLTGTSAAAALAARWMVVKAAEGCYDLMSGLAPLPARPPAIDEESWTARIGKKGIVPIGLCAPYWLG